MAEIEDLDSDLLPFGCSPLHVVANSGDVKSLRLLLQSCSQNVDVFDRHGRTPLAVALQNGRFHAAQVLIEAGASLEASFDGVCSISKVLSTAPFCGFLETLIKGGVFVSLNPDFHVPLVHSAAYDGRTPFLQKLLDSYEIDVNSYDDLGQTPLHYASRRNKSDCVEILLKFGANAMLVNHQGSTALHLACIGGHLDVVTHLLQDCDVAKLINAQDLQGRTPLHIALHYKKLELFDYIMSNFRHSLDFSLCDDSGESIPALLYVLKTNSRFAPEYRKTLHIIGSEEASWILFEGVSQNNLGLVRHSIASGAIVDCVDYMQQTPLLLASKIASLEVIETLINAGADPNVADTGGKTAMQYACELGHLDIASYLLSLEQLDLNQFSDGYNNPLTTELLSSLIEHIRDYPSRKPKNWKKWLTLACKNPSIPINLFDQLVSVICPNNWIECLTSHEPFCESDDDVRTRSPYTTKRLPQLPVLVDRADGHKRASQVYNTLKSKRMPLKKRKQLAKKIGGAFACMRQRAPPKIFTSCFRKQPHEFNHNIPFHCHFKMINVYPVHEAALHKCTAVLEYILSNAREHSMSLLKQLLMETKNNCCQTVAEIIARQYQVFKETVLKLNIREVVFNAVSNIWALHQNYSKSLLHYIASKGK